MLFRHRTEITSPVSSAPLPQWRRALPSKAAGVLLASQCSPRGGCGSSGGMRCGCGRVRLREVMQRLWQSSAQGDVDKVGVLRVGCSYLQAESCRRARPAGWVLISGSRPDPALWCAWVGGSEALVVPSGGGVAAADDKVGCWMRRGACGSGRHRSGVVSLVMWLQVRAGVAPAGLQLLGRWCLLEATFCCEACAGSWRCGSLPSCWL